MRKWWNDFRRLLSGRAKGNEGQASAAPLWSDTPHRAQPGFEYRLYQAIRWYGRRKARQEIKTIHRRLISDKPDSPLARRLRSIFPGGNTR